MAFGPVRFERRRRTAGRDPRFEQLLALRLRRVPAEPVARARKLPRGFEILRVLLQAVGPDRRGLPGAARSSRFAYSASGSPTAPRGASAAAWLRRAASAAGYRRAAI